MPHAPYYLSKFRRCPAGLLVKELKDGSAWYLGLQGLPSVCQLESLRLSLAMLYWETAMFLSLVANAGLSGVTCALYPLERSLMLAPLVLTHLCTDCWTLPKWHPALPMVSRNPLLERRWPETILLRGLPHPAEAGSQALLSSALLFSLSLPASALHLPHFLHIGPVL